ncbi:MAG: ATP-binding protein, partial [Gemmataceae bacterium]
IKKRPDGVTVSIDVPAELPQVKVDYENLQKIVGPLLDNALDAIVGPGRISISGRTVDLNRGNCMELYGSPEPGPHVELTITDTGRGMPAEVKKAPFANPFFTGKQKKRGFGLATCYGILQSIRGGIQFSYPEEGGVSVRILLPVAGSAAIPLSQTVGRIPASQAQGAKPKDTAPPPPQKKS